MPVGTLVSVLSTFLINGTFFANPNIFGAFVCLNGVPIKYKQAQMIFIAANE